MEGDGGVKSRKGGGICGREGVPPRTLSDSSTLRHEVYSTGDRLCYYWFPLSFDIVALDLCSCQLGEICPLEAAATSNMSIL